MNSSQDAVSDLVEGHLPLARHLAHRYTGRGVEVEDLEQVASLALVKAARRYRPDRGPFPPYAVATIRGELKRYFRDSAWSVRPPRRVQEMQASISALEPEDAGHAHPHDLARSLDAPVVEVSEAMAARGCFRADSVERPLPGTGLTLADTLAEPDEAMEAVEDWVTFCRACKELRDDERELLALRFVQEWTQQQIADRLGISQMQVSRRLRTTLDRLRAKAGVAA